MQRAHEGSGGPDAEKHMAAPEFDVLSFGAFANCKFQKFLGYVAPLLSTSLFGLIVIVALDTLTCRYGVDEKIFKFCSMGF